MSDVLKIHENPDIKPQNIYMYIPLEIWLSLIAANHRTVGFYTWTLMVVTWSFLIGGEEIMPYANGVNFPGNISTSLVVYWLFCAN